MTEKATSTEKTIEASEEQKDFVPFSKKNKIFAIITEVNDVTVTVTGKKGTFTFVLDSIKNPEEGLTVNLSKDEDGNWIPKLEPKTKKTSKGNPVSLNDAQMATINSYF